MSQSEPLHVLLYHLTFNIHAKTQRLSDFFVVVDSVLTHNISGILVSSTTTDNADGSAAAATPNSGVR